MKLASRERGSGTIITAMVMMVVLALTGLGVWALGWFRSHAIAADAADLGALTAARAYVGDPQADAWSACQKAAKTVKRNGARTDNCVFAGDETSFTVTVTTEADLWPRIAVPGAPKRVRASAVAGSANAG